MAGRLRQTRPPKSAAIGRSRRKWCDGDFFSIRESRRSQWQRFLRKDFLVKGAKRRLRRSKTLDDVDGPTPTASECQSVVAGAPQGRDRPWSSLAESALIWARTSFTSTHWRANADRR